VVPVRDRQKRAQVLAESLRILFMPMLSAQPSSTSIRWASNVQACHISSWLMALAGM
jgi:hypothetical protein